MDYRLPHTSAPPTPSMTEGPTHSDVSTTKSSSTMSASLHQRLRDRKLELQREGKLAGNDQDSQQSDGDDAITQMEISQSRSTVNDRRTASGIGRRRPTAQMGFREQEQHIGKLDKQNFDLKLRVYHQEIKIRELYAESQRKNEEGEELMKLIDDQQKELDKREASMKEAVDSILLLQDKVRHLEKLASATRPPSNRLRYSLQRRTDDLDAQLANHKPSLATHHGSPKLTVRRASHSDMANGSDNGMPDIDATQDALGVPFIKELDAINRDHHGLRARTMSALSRNTDDSRYHGDYMPAHSPAMSVLSEGDFESVYNWKEQSGDNSPPPRPHSADLSELWTEAAAMHDDDRYRSLYADSITYNSMGKEHPQPDATNLSIDSSLMSRTHQILPDYAIPGLEVSNTFHRKTTNSGTVPRRPLRKRNSDSSLPNPNPEMPANTEKDPSFGREHSKTQISHKEDANKGIDLEFRQGMKAPMTPLRRVQPAVGSSRATNGLSPTKGPNAPSAGPFSTRVGRFENYGFLDSQPATPVLLGKQLQDGGKRAPCNVGQLSSRQTRERGGRIREPNSPTPAQSQTASRKDQQILEYIAQQRVNDWIDKAPRRSLAMAAPMFEDRRTNSEERTRTKAQRHSYHPLPPTPPDTASAVNSASPKTSGTLEGARATDDNHEFSPARPTFKRATESYPAQPHRLSNIQQQLLTDRTTQSQINDALPVHTEQTQQLKILAAQTRDGVSNVLNALTEPPKRNSVSFAPETRIELPAKHDEAEDGAIVVSTDEAPVVTKVHPPVSLATSRLGFAGRFRRRRGSSGAGRAAASLSLPDQGSSATSPTTTTATTTTSQESEELALADEGAEESSEAAKARRRASFTALKFSALGRKIF